MIIRYLDPKGFWQVQVPRVRAETVLHGGADSTHERKSPS